MKKHIYAIKNIKNNKIYIGQTKDLKSRWEGHKKKLRKNKHDNIHLQRAWNKYKEENFEFKSIIFTENYNEEEIKYIKFYNSNNPKYGYNIMLGGENPPIIRGEDSLLSNHTYVEINKLKYDLKYSNLSISELANKYHYTNSGVNRVNNGESWKDENEKYPLRENSISPEILDYIISQLLNTEKTQKQIAQELKLSRSAITMINIGENHKRKDTEYPIRKIGTSTIKKEKRDKVIIEYLLNNKNKTFTEISKIFNTDLSIIYRINTGEKHKYEEYTYPIK